MLKSLSLCQGNKIIRLFTTTTKSCHFLLKKPNMIAQYEPSPSKLNLKLAQQELNAYLRDKIVKYGDIWPLASSLNPLPIVVTREHLAEFEQIQRSLYFAIKAIVSNYSRDSRIRDIFKFSAKTRAILDLYRDKSNGQVGSYR
jgi:hypothetical protein